jgi:hypothetical protein
MSRRSSILTSMSLCATVLLSGCAMMDSGRNWLTGKRNDQSEPDLAEDKWAFVGKEGRGSRRMEKEDPLDRLLWSPQARDINRNVGFE